MIRRPPRSTQSRSSAASDVYKRQEEPNRCRWEHQPTALVPEAVARLLSFPIGHLLDLTLNRHGSSLPTRQQPLLTALHSKVHHHQSPAFVHQAALGDDLIPHREDQSSVGDIVKIEAILPHCGGDACKPISYLLQLHAKKTHDPVSVSDTLYAIQRSFLQKPTSPSNPRDAGTPPPCLLYTSDAADDLLCVDLGGRRIIKKKNNNQLAIQS